MIKVVHCLNCLYVSGKNTYLPGGKGTCPECNCNASMFVNPTYDLDGREIYYYKADHEIAVEMKRQEKMRKFNQVIKGQSLKTLKQMFYVLIDRLCNFNNDGNEETFTVDELDAYIDKLIRVRHRMIHNIETTSNDEKYTVEDF